MSKKRKLDYLAPYLQMNVKKQQVLHELYLPVDLWYYIIQWFGMDCIGLFQCNKKYISNSLLGYFLQNGIRQNALPFPCLSEKVEHLKNGILDTSSLLSIYRLLQTLPLSLSTFWACVSNLIEQGVNEKEIQTFITQREDHQLLLSQGSHIQYLLYLLLRPKWFFHYHHFILDLLNEQPNRFGYALANSQLSLIVRKKSFVPLKSILEVFSLSIVMKKSLQVTFIECCNHSLTSVMHVMYQWIQTQPYSRGFWDKLAIHGMKHCMKYNLETSGKWIELHYVTYSMYPAFLDTFLLCCQEKKRFGMHLFLDQIYNPLNPYRDTLKKMIFNEIYRIGIVGQISLFEIVLHFLFYSFPDLLTEWMTSKGYVLLIELIERADLLTLPHSRATILILLSYKQFFFHLPLPIYMSTLTYIIQRVLHLFDHYLQSQSQPRSISPTTWFFVICDLLKRPDVTGIPEEFSLIHLGCYYSDHYFLQFLHHIRETQLAKIKCPIPATSSILPLPFSAIATTTTAAAAIAHPPLLPSSFSV